MLRAAAPAQPDHPERVQISSWQPAQKLVRLRLERCLNSAALLIYADQCRMHRTCRDCERGPSRLYIGTEHWLLRAESMRSWLSITSRMRSARLVKVLQFLNSGRAVWLLIIVLASHDVRKVRVQMCKELKWVSRVLWSSAGPGSL